MNRFTALLVGALAGAAAAGCNGTPATAKPAKPAAPVLTLTPPPGTYFAFAMAVSAAAPSTGQTLFYTLDAPPSVTGPAYHGRFSVRIVKSSSIQVLVRDPARNTWGPLVYEYRLVQRVSEGQCSLEPLPRVYYRPHEPIGVTLHFVRPTALSGVELLIDGTPVPVTVDPDMADGSVTYRVETLAAEGSHSVSCRVKSSTGAIWAGNTLAPVIDGTPPEGGWVSSGGSFTHENWNGVFMFHSHDALSGIAGARVCSSATVCIPLTPFLPDTYAYATALTDGSAGGAALSFEVTDQAGNVLTSPLLTFSLASFAEPRNASSLPITLTTAPILDLPTAIGDSVAAGVRHPDFTPYLPGQPLNALPLTPGWNEFLFRRPGRTEWETYSIYRNGVSVELPASAYSWLVYATNSTVPTYQARLVDVFPGNATAPSSWRKAWFDVPHLFFVENRGASPGQWDAYGRLFTLPADALNSGWLARATPVDATAAAAPVADPLAGQPVTVTVSCPACIAPGQLVFDRRITPFSYPVSHAVVSASMPASVTVRADAGDTCLFFWDTNLDGVVGETEARSTAPCGAAAVTLDARKEPFRYDYQGWRLYGVPYGSLVTGIGRIYVSPGDTTPAVTKLLPTAFEASGLGSLSTLTSRYGERLMFLPLDMTLTYDLWSAGSVTTVAFPPVPDTNMYPIHVNVSVTDETGAPLAALVTVAQTGQNAWKMADASGNAPMGLRNLNPANALFAEHDGYLSEWKVLAPGASVASLRLLRQGLTGTVHGYVTDSAGQPVSGATLVWKGPQWRAETFSGADGYYAMPASGGAGQLLVSAPGTYRREVDYPLYVTRTAQFQWVELPLDHGSLWPQGLTGSYSLSATGPGRAALLLNDLYYGLETDGTRGAWMISANGISRSIHPSGALPAFLGFPANGFLSPRSSATPFMNSWVQCGDLTQPVQGGARADSTCWAWWAQDRDDLVFFSRLDPATGFPPLLGYENFSTMVYWQGAIAPDQPLVLQDLFLPRVLRTVVSAGLLFKNLPWGVYRIMTLGGAILEDADGNDQFVVNAQTQVPPYLIIP